MALTNPTSSPFGAIALRAAAALQHPDSGLSWIRGSGGPEGTKSAFPSQDAPQLSYSPWTHEPLCLPVLPGQPGADVVTEYCVYTKASTDGASISVVATPQMADHLVHHTNLSLPRDMGTNRSPYSKRSTADRGIAVFAGRHILMGEVIMTDHPVLMVMTQTYWQLTSSQIQDAQWLALRQLPPGARKAARALARSSDGDELESIMRTNSIRVDNGRQFLALAPEAAVRGQHPLVSTTMLTSTQRINHACRPK